MANLCITEYVFCGEKNNLHRFFNDLKKILDVDKTKTEKPFTFIGSSYILNNIQKCLLPELKEKLPVRGEISYIEEGIEYFNDNMASIKMETETAWCACSELMDKLSEKYNLQFFYYSEEPGFKIFETNDIDGLYFPYRYVVDSNNGIEYYDSFNQIADAIEQKTGIRLNDISEAEEKLSNFNNDESYLTVNEIAVV